MYYPYEQPERESVGKPIVKKPRDLANLKVG